MTEQNEPPPERAPFSVPPPAPEPEVPETVARSAWGETKKQLLADFSAWLDQLDGFPLDETGGSEASEVDPPDLFSFYSELAALRRDSQLQAKAVQGMRENITELGDALQAEAKLQTQVAADAASDLRSELPRARREAQAVAMSTLIELVEGLGRSDQHLAEASLPMFPGRKARRERIMAELRTPVTLLAAKARDALQRLGVRPVASVGDPFDSRTMRVVATVEETGHHGGRVYEIVRQGYTLQNGVLQLAEVKVNQ